MRPDNVQLSQSEPASMHIFDIRRSNSVTELWKQFERPNDGTRSQQMISDVPVETESAIDEHEHKEEPAAHEAATISPPEAESQPFMAAFEAELASLLSPAENSGQRATQPEASSAAEPSSSDSNSRGAHHPLEVVAATFLFHLINGANSVQSELRSKLPELQEQLRNAQRTVPENVRTSLQSLLATIEAHMRTAFHNFPDNGRQFAEDAINAGRPVAEHAADGLRMMASELNEASRTLFAAFENEFGRLASNASNATSDEGLHAASTPIPGATPDGTAPDLSSQNTNPYPTNPGVQNDATASSGQPVQIPEVNPNTLSSDLKGPSWDTARDGQGDHFYVPGPHHPPPFPPRPAHPAVPPMPPRDCFIPHSHSHPPTHPPWHMPWDPAHPIRHHPPPLPPPPPSSYLGEPWLPSNHWFSPFIPHNPHTVPRMPPAPPPKEIPRDQDELSVPSEKKALFIGNVGFNVTEKMIQDVFASKGFIVSVRLPQDSNTGKHAGFGYIDFPSIHPAMAAMDVLQGFHIDGHAINLEFSDDAIIDSVPPPEHPGLAEPRTLYETFAHQSRPLSRDFGISRPDQTGPGASANKPERPRRVSRRKSVTFQEPDLSSLDLQDKSATGKDTPARLQSPPLIDLTTDDAASNHQSNEMHDQLPEMSRFPPVSQLEAQLFANQQQSRALEPSSDATIRQESPESIWDRDYDQPMGSYEPVPVHDVHGEESSPWSNGGRLKHIGPGGPGLRRSKTMTFARRGGERPDVPNPVFPGGPAGQIPLRRRASERHHLRRDTHDPSDTDTWARLDRRERRRPRRSSHHSIPGSFPVEEISQPVPSDPLDANTESQKTDIDECVSSLIDMGYGSAEDGGHSRMAVYAAASNGNLNDAIEMIEEEREAYARQC